MGIAAINMAGYLLFKDWTKSGISSIIKPSETESSSMCARLPQALALYHHLVDSKHTC